jgi:hypothetical protein
MIFASIVTIRIARLAQSSSFRNECEWLQLCASRQQIAFALRHGDPGRRHRIECLSAIPKGILTTEESVVKAENITCHNRVLRRSTCGCSRYWPDWVPGTLKGRHPDTKREARKDWGAANQRLQQSFVSGWRSLTYLFRLVARAFVYGSDFIFLCLGHNQPEPMRGQYATKRNRNDIVTVDLLPESRSGIWCLQSQGKEH